MAGSRFAYVRSFELPDPVLPGVFMVVRIDGKGFHGFSQAHEFEKPNDAVALELMNHAARHVCQELRGDVTLAFGESDEYSFLLKKSCKLYNRRESKIVTHIVSLFTSAYVFYWPQYFPKKALQGPPSFDGRLVVYPGVQEVKDYFAWRQADTHINNLYNTTFWSLVLLSNPPLSERQAHETLKGTVSSQKNEILFSKFAINYERLPAMFRKGTTVVLAPTRPSSKVRKSKRRKAHPRELRTLHVDIIGSAFWEEPEAGAKAAARAEGGEERSKSESCRGAGVEDGLEHRKRLYIPIPSSVQADAAPFPPWEAPDRTQGTAGLGRWALRH
ncbi:Thg1-domain-containing protein [Microstroma glucosiphilum]|uniref:tRNA(His) guanylyltransferase n=1 Tax=Pseudomicrostroma glucosiphilum TaxID=1684307 RepID=A0A316U9J7_9BASI|nr:Thg1-domain-containing protein [Pseudomicrostroma glucosiphilum]PWN19675.1 Thg1-domain-containing protein [Pseudomicrostroma glucosiphilum]